MDQTIQKATSVFNPNNPAERLGYAIQFDKPTIVLNPTNGSLTMDQFILQTNSCVAMNTNFYDPALKPIGIYKTTYHECPECASRNFIDGALVSASSLNMNGEFNEIQGDLYNVNIYLKGGNISPDTNLTRGSSLFQNSNVNWGISGSIAINNFQRIDFGATKANKYPFIAVTENGDIWGVVFDITVDPDLATDAINKHFQAQNIRIKYALLLDGGGSTQLYVNGENLVSSSRPHYFIGSQCSGNNPSDIGAGGGTSENNQCLSQCINCMLYPVSKTAQVPYTSKPALQALSKFPEMYVTNETNSAFDSLNKAAISAQLDLQVVSGYRDAVYQQQLFEGYMKDEQTKDPTITREEAETRANKYSAKPGYSEHQLGTVLDITCNGCVAFANDSKNKTVYTFLENNAYKYGFAISYPPLTNPNSNDYIAEPWHIRYIGKEYAQEYYNLRKTNSDLTLKSFLESKCSSQNSLL